jgi:hypothetical protein
VRGNFQKGKWSLNQYRHQHQYPAPKSVLALRQFTDEERNSGSDVGRG